MEATWVKNPNWASWDLIHTFYVLDEGHKEHNYGWVEKQKDGWVAEHPITPVDENGEFDPEISDCKTIGRFLTSGEAKAAVEKENPPPPCFGGTYI